MPLEPSPPSQRGKLRLRKESDWLNSKSLACLSLKPEHLPSSREQIPLSFPPNTLATFLLLLPAHKFTKVGVPLLAAPQPSLPVPADHEKQVGAAPGSRSPQLRTARTHST